MYDWLPLLKLVQILLLLCLLLKVIKIYLVLTLAFIKKLFRPFLFLLFIFFFFLFQSLLLHLTTKKSTELLKVTVCLAKPMFLTTSLWVFDHLWQFSFEVSHDSLGWYIPSVKVRVRAEDGLGALLLCRTLLLSLWTLYLVLRWNAFRDCW